MKITLHSEEWVCDLHPAKTLASFLVSVWCRCLAQRSTASQLRVPGTKQNHMVGRCHVHAGMHTYTQQVTIKERLCVNEPCLPAPSIWSEVDLPVSDQNFFSIVVLLLEDWVVVVKSKNITADTCWFCRECLTFLLYVNNVSNHPFP